MTETQRAAMQAALDALQSGILELNYVDKPRACVPLHEARSALRAALAEPVVEPYGHVTVRRLSQQFENHVDQYTFYPAGYPPYLDNVDECIAVYTAPQPQQPAEASLLSDDEIRALFMAHAKKNEHGVPYLTTYIEGGTHLIRTVEQAVRQKAGLV